MCHRRPLNENCLHFTASWMHLATPQSMYIHNDRWQLSPATSHLIQDTPSSNHNTPYAWINSICPQQKNSVYGSSLQVSSRHPPPFKLCSRSTTSTSSNQTKRQVEPKCQTAIHTAACMQANTFQPKNGSRGNSYEVNKIRVIEYNSLEKKI